MKKLFLLALGALFAVVVHAQQVPQPFNGLGLGLGNLPALSNAESRSISPENFTGEKGKGGAAKMSDTIYPNHANSAGSARELGRGWKLNPYIIIKPGQTFTLAEMNGPGAIQHIWMT